MEDEINQTPNEAPEAPVEESIEEVEAPVEEPVVTKVVDNEGNPQVELSNGEAAFVGVEAGLDTKYGIFKKNVPVKVSSEAKKYLEKNFKKSFIFG